MNGNIHPESERSISFGGPQEERAVSRHELRRYQAGELGAARRAEILAVLDASAAQFDANLKAEFDELENEKRAFAASMPFARFAARHQAAQPQTLLGVLSKRLQAMRWQVGGLSLAAGAAAVLLMVTPTGNTDHPGENQVTGNQATGTQAAGTETGHGQTGHGIRLKGQGHIGLFVREGNGTRLGVDGEELHPGDQIQFVLRDAAEQTAMVLLGVDGNGVVTIYDARRLPRTTTKGADVVRAERRTLGRARVLEQSLILDDALGPERFFVLYGDDDLDVLKRNARRAARMLAASKTDLSSAERLQIGGGNVKQSSIHIVKTKK